MNPTAVINIAALSRSLINDRDTPRIAQHATEHGCSSITPVLPAVTCSVQSSMLTAVAPAEHGVVANGWFDRTLNEVQFWKQSNALVTGDKLWDIARQRNAAFTCANMFWWFNMYSSVDYAVTPRPQYKADGRKIPDIHTHPPELRDQLQYDLGRFPLFNFWGPAASIKSSRWIADASMFIHKRFAPTLMLIYLPHLDYPLQKLGPGHRDIPAHAAQIDRIVGDLIDFFTERQITTILLSEYGIEPVRTVVEINRFFRREGLITIRDEAGELLDAGASRCFAVADHQIAHIYIRDPADRPRITDMCRGLDGVADVLTPDLQQQRGIHHARSGDLVLVADAGAWFCYHYWLDDAAAPDFARTVDIHRKPGYDPLELFLDPAKTFIRARIAGALARKKLGMRALLEVIPLDNSLVRGSHGRVDMPDDLQPVLIGPGATADAPLPCTAVRDIILDNIFSARS